jgi:hypothetical protein
MISIMSEYKYYIGFTELAYFFRVGVTIPRSLDVSSWYLNLSRICCTTQKRKSVFFQELIFQPRTAAEKNIAPLNGESTDPPCFSS